MRRFARFAVLSWYGVLCSLLAWRETLHNSNPCFMNLNATLMQYHRLPARPLIARKPLARLAEFSINAPVTGGCCC